ncbi:copper amine oxidase N-terminal domain-containing protein [Brevibacillus humidisoli]|uniref:copper amine oxidase N-terminal domain-containing protein n=1 Tax=Brevibacillus humidisoli TaxID=2895522 RepID=UPI001E556EAC|nr:copper amine oxidase N-terminal domain-containing protein [Brevibacillus humidisoli]UFJ39284.1 copper amine oxidase N-terminal domain-containing protein [Brevibacillus humidisoli]
MAQLRNKLAAAIIIPMLLAAPAPLPASAGAESEIVITLDGKRLPLQGEIHNGHTMVPLRSLSEVLGFRVTWEPADKQITLQSDSKVIQLRVDEHRVNVNDHDLFMETAPVMQDGTTLIPLRFVSNHLGMEVSWDEATRFVHLQHKEENDLTLVTKKNQKNWTTDRLPSSTHK